MSGFLLKEPQTFINIKLTDTGRRQLSLGQLHFVSAVVSDREVDYGIDRTEHYNIISNRILAPKDAQPFFGSNFDGTDPVILGDKQVTSAKQFSTATTLSASFFTGSTNAFAIDNTKYKGKASITYSTSPIQGGNSIKLNTGSYTAITGDLVFIPWEPIQNISHAYNSSDIISSGNPTVMLWYRVASAATNHTNIVLDRPIPNFGSVMTSQQIDIYFYPYNALETYYGSAATVDVKVWNMNIVRTNSVEGTDNTFSGYTSYGSIEYNGTKHYLGFSAETSVIGFIHFTNAFTGNTYAEQLVEKSVSLNMPTVLWHNSGADNGTGIDFGLTVYDVDGDTIFDTVSQTTYRYLKDSVSSGGKIVGRVYHKLKLIVIIDPELLTALTYKADRNYTLPKLNLTLTSNPKFPLATSAATGLCKSGYTYFVTYVAESFSAYTSSISATTSTFGYGPALHCAYISTIEGQVDVDGNPQYLNASFPSRSFPYLRSAANMSPFSSFSGTGWNTNKVQLLVNEQLSSLGYNVGNVPASDWKRMSALSGNGVYNGDTGDATIDPLKLAGFSFNVSQQDSDSGSTYVLNDMFKVGTDHTTTGLTFGNESFFFGSVDTNIMATTFKSIITVFAKNAQFNSSDNASFDSIADENTYITEIGILDDSNNLVAVGKPTFPIKKSERRFLAFQLEIDF